MEKQDARTIYNPTSHCLECIPAVTHTKQGVCATLCRGNKTLIMDIIPVIPKPPGCHVMGLYKMVTTSLPREMPPGWKRAYKAYFGKDKVIPEDVHDLSQDETSQDETSQDETSQDDIKKRGKYILVKLLNYGPRPNYQIRAAQSLNAIAKLTGSKEDLKAFMYGKTLLKLLKIEDVGSYLLKKVFLTRTNMWREMSAAHRQTEEMHERMALLTLLESPEVLRQFGRRINIGHEDFHLKLVNEGIILLNHEDSDSQSNGRYPVQ